MTEQNKQDALSILGNGLAKIVNNYSENALLINSCFVAADRYRTITGTTGLSTTVNIPVELRLDNEIDVQYTNEDLVRKYSLDVQNIVFQNYVIASVSLVDATLEDLYEHFIKVYNPAITEAELEKQIRNAWTNDNLLTFLTNPGSVHLQKPNDKQTEFSEAFMRYSELRILRHSLLHTNGKLSDKNHQKLQDNLANTPNKRKHFAMANSPLFNANREIVLSINHILSIRQYLDRFLMYLYQSINERPIV
ncbi:hypothetical protein [Flavihumibacter petaseus]|uniref:RiboL-PSP-HEPN domain-containing protein n=1 Tax=Flavihumibacter petaseus NBRC 106054 TaxID=1220578 RepID=A0A0E9N245_9BACT|nr:hypothetical protein [Flavihumibacter petaseus]GAO43736.1 hypothetical protein FPE01S_02_08420 [Flavihumibacter petaseus NBRC 106054]